MTWSSASLSLYSELIFLVISLLHLSFQYSNMFAPMNASIQWSFQWDEYFRNLTKLNSLLTLIAIKINCWQLARIELIQILFFIEMRVDFFSLSRSLYNPVIVFHSILIIRTLASQGWGQFQDKGTTLSIVQTPLSVYLLHSANPPLSVYLCLVRELPKLFFFRAYMYITSC